MLIVLPPSETKAHGGDSGPLRWDRLSFPSLTPRRRAIAADLARLPVDKALGVLGISERLRPEAELNARLLSSPTMPALERYTGVLYDALDAPTLPLRARERLAVGSALFGLLRADDPIPHYRLSASTKLPDAAGATPTMKARWGAAITEALGEVDGLVVDLRSGGYQQLGRLPGALTVRVESVREDGSRKVVSHFNKHYKGQLARVLALSDAAPADAPGVAEVARAAGMTVEENSPTELTLVV
ncbi:peroxide stress protein YaaA [Corynebacterium mastitidis]|uniref:Peroxide stress protein YaaA n=1 Tax=Corynebacterium mastitidis TaxID=161890 RepID=A0A2N0X6Q0_9CORY|nr:peroxide stress protein YaaA [Corynebacterium mastitidis]MCH6196644.1 peroxide stress protein YaaA [Corynebacterium mastitidis]PKF68375.1 peroxide stress protein YaaA [Corynebacterium mastitidis]